MMARREAESGMRDACKATVLVKSEVLDEDTGEYPMVPRTIYEGKARLKHPRSMAQAKDAGSQLVVMTSMEIQIPVDSDDLPAGCVVEITRCPDRPRQVGREFSVVGPFDGSQTTALRYRIEVSDER